MTKSSAFLKSVGNIYQSDSLIISLMSSNPLLNLPQSSHDAYKNARKPISSPIVTNIIDNILCDWNSYLTIAYKNNFRISMKLRVNHTQKNRKNALKFSQTTTILTEFTKIHWNAHIFYDYSQSNSHFTRSQAVKWSYLENGCSDRQNKHFLIVQSPDSFELFDGFFWCTWTNPMDARISWWICSLLTGLKSRP